MFDVINPVTVGGGIGVLVFAGILAMLAAGRRLGKRSILQHGGAGPSTIGSLETAVFALLGLMIAFTFSGALQRFDVRRGQAVDEANAMGTAWLRIDLLPPAAQPALREVMRNYVDSRIATYRRLPDMAAVRQEMARSGALQGELWSGVVAAVRLPDARPGAEVLVVPAFNQMFDLSTMRLVATTVHPPTIVYAMLIGLALAAALLAGYQSAGERVPDLLHRLAFAAIIGLTVYVIFEIEYPRLGWVRIDDIDSVLVNARAAMK